MTPPQFHTLIFHVTDNCNLRCRHCWQGAHYDDAPGGEDFSNAMTVEEFSDVLAQSMELGGTCIKFTGGEPFAHPQMMDYLEIARRRGFSIVIETNATLLNRDRINSLKSLESLFLSISLDGADPPTHNRFRGAAGAFEKTLTAFDHLSEFDIGFQVIACLHRDNIEQIPKMAHMLSEYSARSFKINPIQPLGRGESMEEEDKLALDILLQTVEEWRHSLTSLFSGEVIFALPMAFKPFSEIQYRQYSVCRIFQILGLMPNGDLSFCGIGAIDPSLVIGNVRKDRLATVWRQSPLLRSLRSGLPKDLCGVCGRCIFKGVCLGECRAMAWKETGHLMGAYWLCQQAMDNGLFPENRLLPVDAAPL